VYFDAADLIFCASLPYASSIHHSRSQSKTSHKSRNRGVSRIFGSRVPINRSPISHFRHPVFNRVIFFVFPKIIFKILLWSEAPMTPGFRRGKNLMAEPFLRVVRRLFTHQRNTRRTMRHFVAERAVQWGPV